MQDAFLGKPRDALGPVVPVDDIAVLVYKAHAVLQMIEQQLV
jgi:hypothetical protein